MVVFTCGHCGESVQKPKVEKHYLTKCRNKNPNLSCMDCFKDFLGDDYESHIKCITEEERYSGKGFQAKEKKGEKKQNAWVEMLQSVLDEQKNASKNVLRIIETIGKHNNTPRKKPKFINFVKNVCGQKTNQKDIDAAWDLISVKLGELANLNSNNKNNKETKDTNGAHNTETNGLPPENDEKIANGVTNGDEHNGINGGNNNEVVNGAAKDDTKLTKKQKKEEKKRKKYEAELQSAEAPRAPTPEAVENIPETNKKGKKNRNKSESGSENVPIEGKNKKKRKRQDTVTNLEVTESVENVENGVAKVKETKKKLKTDEEGDESVCLHDQNVAKIEETAESNGKFNWHDVIISALKKKDNELPFKRLQKKVLGEYSEFTGCDIDDRIADKFIKKLKSAPNVRVDKNRVTLVEE
ncbi:cell growth-regulating nucleolar protein [Leptidea sinapis]|uniref:cell growth-regulating nucleolar protein n=1 Tax=Leptidea sinapis TaxID=189913 RepID=UPI002132AFE9|nr:cell growth-regulating nucleolar protein [Leptidea sinapis]